ncbi:MAG: hypothetical protein MI754_06210 [Chromatiales bacterium]|nr:hypothetical protein [Chromatiales bacterium]
MDNTTTEVFFRAEPIAVESTSIPAQLYNRCRLLQSRCTNEHLFVPIRTMQYLAVVDNYEVIFVDSQAYTVSQGEGGRMIILSWFFKGGAGRDSLDQPIPMQIHYHHENGREAQRRIIVEFDKALIDLAQRMTEKGCDPKLKKVLPFPDS